MKLQKKFLCAAVALMAFGLSLGLMDIGQYLRTAFSAETKKIEPVKALTVEKITYPSFTPVVEKTDSVVESNENTETEFYADGDYYIIGDLPKGFKDFDTLTVITQDYAESSEENNYRSVLIPPKGFIQTKKEFNFTRINIANKQIALETQAKNGISYQFVGEFIEEEIKYKYKDDEYPAYAVLKGRLIKMRDGKKIAESEVKFAAGGC